MSEPDRTAFVAAYRVLLEQCRELYASSGELIVRQHRELAADSDEFVDRMVELHRGLAVKLYLAIVEADGRWSSTERELGRVLLESVWERTLDDAQLREAMRELSAKVDELGWFALVRPFEQMAPLRERIGEVETLIVRMANVVAKCDGELCERELRRLKSIQDEIRCHLRPLRIDEPGQHELAEEMSQQTVRSIKDASPPLKSTEGKSAASTTPPKKTPQETLDEGLAELDALIGLDSIKRDVRSLINFLRIQDERARAGLPRTKVGLHMLFYGNPGTGKTTVARILGKLLGAMGLLKRGHLVETDRSGLVAGYAGQTALKANKKLDEALDGILFIDEAYSLASEGSDPYGAEAVQVLLKRMEDDRERLVVILAGYPQPMDALLGTNPGLASRFQRRFDFADYSVTELCRIFQAMCDKNHYVLPPATRERLVLGFDCLVQRRDERFGNGRLVRNAFETAIRHLANRVAAVTPLTKQLLERLEPADIELPKLTVECWSALYEAGRMLDVACPGCERRSRLRPAHLGRRTKCKHCGHKFQTEWAAPLPVD